MPYALYRIGRLTDFLSHVDSERLTFQPSAKHTWQMRHHDIERVATHHASRNMKYVARRALSRLLFDTKEFRLYQFESLWLIEQRDIYSARIRRFGNAIFVAQISQRTSAPSSNIAADSSHELRRAGIRCRF